MTTEHCNKCKLLSDCKREYFNDDPPCATNSAGGTQPASTNNAMDAIREIRAAMESNLCSFAKCDKVNEILEQHQ